jgi:hypothetical protein
MIVRKCTSFHSCTLKHWSALCFPAVPAAALLQPTIKLDKTGPTKVFNAGEEFEFELKASVTSGTVTSMILTDPMPAGSGLRLIKSTPAAPCVITESLARCTLTGPFPQTIKLTAVGSVKGEFKNEALLTAGGVTTADDANVTVFVPTCGEVTPGGGPFSRCPAGNEYNPSFAGRTPANSFTCCVSGCSVQACSLCSPS